MKNIFLPFLLLPAFLIFSFSLKAQNNPKIIIIRHAEKQMQNENLNCMGLNRSLKLVNVLYKKIGIPSSIYVPSLGSGSTTTHSRMFQTITPFAVKYNLSINSSYQGNDPASVAKEVLKEKGTVLLVWNHGKIPALAKALGVKGEKLKWNENDFDSIWIITGKKKDKILTVDKEGIVPAAGCPVF